MSIFSVDIEANGPDPLGYSMVQIGAVLVDPGGKLDKTFYAELRPRRHTAFEPEALRSCGLTHDQTLAYPYASIAMKDLTKWLYKSNLKGRIEMLTDNPGFDWQFVNSYMWHYTRRNPFGFSCFSLTSMYKGFAKNHRKSFKHLRVTKHTHNPVDDARGNAEALVKLIEMGYECKL